MQLDQRFDGLPQGQVALAPMIKCWATGRDDRIRTCDPHTPSVMRYQAALRPVSSGGAPIGRVLMAGKVFARLFLGLAWWTPEPAKKKRDCGWLALLLGARS